MVISAGMQNASGSQQALSGGCPVACSSKQATLHCAQGDAAQPPNVRASEVEQVRGATLKQCGSLVAAGGGGATG